MILLFFLSFFLNILPLPCRWHPCLFCFVCVRTWATTMIALWPCACMRERERKNENFRILHGFDVCARAHGQHTGGVDCGCLLFNQRISWNIFSFFLLLVVEQIPCATPANIYYTYNWKRNDEIWFYVAGSFLLSCAARASIMRRCARQLNLLLSISHHIWMSDERSYKFAHWRMSEDNRKKGCESICF